MLTPCKHNTWICLLDLFEDASPEIGIANVSVLPHIIRRVVQPHLTTPSLSHFFHAFLSLSQNEICDLKKGYVSSWANKDKRINSSWNWAAVMAKMKASQ